MNKYVASPEVSQFYEGKLFIQIPTDEILSDFDTVDILNELSERIINEIGSDLTTWVFSSHGNAIKGVLEIQKKDYAFRLMGENDLLFISYKW